MIQYVDPVAQCLVPARAYTLRVDLSRAQRVGLVVNKIVDCDVFMSHLGEAMATHFPALELQTYLTGKITFADHDLIEQIAQECDAAVCAIGHCGSCTAGTVKDAIALIENGIPAVSLITDVFWEQGAALARSLGWPDAPRLKLPYPVWGSGEASVREVAGSIVPSVEATLSGVSNA
ncbi:MAG: hypothetical protein AAF434_08815 [Pseudomonadota bacterium]